MPVSAEILVLREPPHAGRFADLRRYRPCDCEPSFADLGEPAEIGHIFATFQKYLYRVET
jgi:hypothetical protein